MGGGAVSSPCLCAQTGLAPVVGSASLVQSLMYGWELFVDMTKRNGADCSHQSTVNGVTGGPERVLCEECGEVIVRDESRTSRDIDRSMFPRKADSAHVMDGAPAKA